MATHTFTLTGRETIEARITIDPGIHTTSAYGLAFNADADTVGDTDSTRYSGYCPTCVAYHEIHRVIAGRWGIESEDIATAVDANMPPCHCDTDEEED
ncbi:hypothetical protein MRBLMI12_000452 [Microbacterium sp. LMI12-1-1.1]|uniref:hypothetical protein n=1 Tax=Microbacterium sp. LMI12-1-1.1 TaxID=3135225 RepID=UPI00342642F4